MKITRNYIKQEQEVNSADDIKVYLEDLKNRKITNVSELQKWMSDRSELDAFLEENAAWRYIKMSCDTENKELAESFSFFVQKVEPLAYEYSDILDRKFMESEFFAELDQEKYKIPVQAVKRKIEMFRKENIQLFADTQDKEQQFGSIAGAMNITYKGEKMTLQQAGNLLKSTDRDERKAVYELINNRRLEDKDKLDTLLSELIEMRTQAAKNVGYDNYRDYKHDALQRFDYTPQDCLNFHDAVAETVMPLVNQMHAERKAKLGYDSLKPYDFEVDTELKPALKAFADGKDLINKAIKVFTKVRPQYGKYLQTMKDEGFLDLDSRIGKRPGGYNYPLYESNIPFIFMNATGNLRDLETMMHEGGHAVHSFLSSHLELTDFKGLPSEVAELASMSMELISLDSMSEFFDNDADIKRARRHQLEGVLKTLPWIAAIDKFQHELYLNPTHSPEERSKIWQEAYAPFSSTVADFSGYEEAYSNRWQAQLHIFEVPFYYIEYGISQLGAIAVWKNYKENPTKGLDAYEAALKLGYSKSIPEIYKTAGIEFNFSKEYIGELMEFVKSELDKI